MDSADGKAYWKGYSWSLLSTLAIVYGICLQRSAEHFLTWSIGLIGGLWIIGILGLFGFAYDVEIFSSSVWKFVFCGFLVRWVYTAWACSLPEVWNTWNIGMFLVTEIFMLLILSPLYIALYLTAYSYGESQNTISEG